MRLTIMGYDTVAFPASLVSAPALLKSHVNHCRYPDHLIRYTGGGNRRVEHVLNSTLK